MNVQIKFLAALLFLLCGIATPSFSKNFSHPSSSTSSLIEDGQPCTLPAPDNYVVKDISTDEIWVGWLAPANNPFEYNIKVFEVSTGNLINSFNIPGTATTARVLNLLPGTEYKIRNTPVCSDGTLSNFFVETVATTLIVDLVSSGFTISGNTTCSLTGQLQFCEANPDSGKIVIFKIRQLNSPYQSKHFGLYKISNQCSLSTIKIRAIETSFQFVCSNDAPARCQGGSVIIKKGGVEVARFSVSTSADSKRLVCISIDSTQYAIDRLGDAAGVSGGLLVTCSNNNNNSLRPAKPTERASDEWEEIPYNQTLTATPNPFTNQLEIRQPFANINEFVEISLYDLQGRQVKALRSPGDLQTITLSTENLSPGMYFLRAESGGQIETVKVVKTQ